MIHDLVLNVCKPPGITSFDVVSRVRRLLGIRKVGHCGTLDPFARGVLVICTGKGTRISEYLMRRTKVYEGVMRFGVKSSTGDPEGEIIETRDSSMVTPSSLGEVIPRFTGKIMQRPHRVSAIKINGQRLYDLAREGKPVEAEAREVSIDNLELLWFTGEDPEPFASSLCENHLVSPGPDGEVDALFRIQCSSGTYIRSLAEDIGEALGTVGMLMSLVRTSVGDFRISNSLPIEKYDQLTALEELPSSAVCDLNTALSFMPELICADSSVRSICNGGSLLESDLGDDLPQIDDEALVRILDSRGALLALHRRSSRIYGGFTRPEKVLASFEDSGCRDETDFSDTSDVSDASDENADSAESGDSEKH
jgi:tRNA pseudouridine55 synthase